MATHHTQHHATPHHVARPKANAGDTGYGLGLAGFITSFFVGVVGLVLSAIALAQSKRAGLTNTFALVGLIIGIVTTAMTVLAFAAVLVGSALFVSYCNDNPNECRESGSYYDSPQEDRTF